MKRGKNKTSKSKDFDSSKTKSFGSARNSKKFRHAQKSKISEILKDKRGMANEDLEKKAGWKGRSSRRGFLAGAFAAVLAAGCALLPGKAVEDYQKEGVYRGVESIQTVHEDKPQEQPWSYNIYKKSGKIFYKGDVFHRGKKRYYHGEIYPIEIVKKVPEEDAIIIRSKDGSYTNGRWAIGERPDGTFIERGISQTPILKDSKSIKRFKKIEEEEDYLKKRGPIEFHPSVFLSR